MNELLSLLIISGMTAVLSNASIKRAMRKLERSVWKTLAGWLDHIIACPPEEPSPPARIENLDTLGIVLEKGTRGKLKIANPSPNENLPSEAYLFALISDIEAPAAIAARLMQTESIWPSFVHPVHSNKILGEVFFPTSNMPAIATQIRPCLAPP